MKWSCSISQLSQSLCICLGCSHLLMVKFILLKASWKSVQFNLITNQILSGSFVNTPPKSLTILIWFRHSFMAYLRELDVQSTCKCNFIKQENRAFYVESLEKCRVFPCTTCIFCLAKQWVLVGPFRSEEKDVLWGNADTELSPLDRMLLSTLMLCICLSKLHDNAVAELTVQDLRMCIEDELLRCNCFFFLFSFIFSLMLFLPSHIIWGEPRGAEACLFVQVLAGRVSFLHCTQMLQCSGFAMRTVLITHRCLFVAEQCLCQVKDFPGSYSELQVRRWGCTRSCEGDIGQLTPAGWRDISHSMAGGVPSNKSWGKEGEGMFGVVFAFPRNHYGNKPCFPGKRWTSAIDGKQVMNSLFCFSCNVASALPTKLFLPHVFSRLPFWSSSISC